MMIKCIAILGMVILAGSVLVASTGVEESQLDGKQNLVRMESLGRQMCAARKLHNLSQKELAQRLHVSICELQSIESGSKRPVKEVIFRAEAILKTTFLSDAAYFDIKP
jgi:ribosome-binding protein aMBF1 (putative translation factor)